MLNGRFKEKGYDWWWHSFTGINEKTGEEKAFFVEYFLCNPGLGGATPVFGQLPENKVRHIRPSYMMVKAGCWGENHRQLHRFFGWSDVSVNSYAPFSLKADDCYASENRIRGSVNVSDAGCHPEYMCDNGSMSWNLKVKKLIPFNVGYGAGALFRKIKAFEMYWHAQGMKTAYTGDVIINGEKYIVSPHNCYGYADKNWGSNFTSPWVWLSSNNLVSNITGEKLENSVFDIGGGCPRVFGIALKRILLGAFYYEGKGYEFNFSKFWTGPSTEFACSEQQDRIEWYVRQENRNAVMETRISCLKKDMLLVNYESPDGMKRHKRLWNGGNGTGNVKLYHKQGDKLLLVDDISVYNTGCEYGEY